MEQKLPGCGLKATPNIEERVKPLKKHYHTIAEMLGLVVDLGGMTEKC